MMIPPALVLVAASLSSITAYAAIWLCDIWPADAPEAVAPKKQKCR